MSATAVSHSVLVSVGAVAQLKRNFDRVVRVGFSLERNMSLRLARDGLRTPAIRSKE
jgi:hypothetical protein